MRLAIMALALAGCSASGASNQAKAGNEAGQSDGWRLSHGRQLLAASEAQLSAPGIVAAPIGGVARIEGRDIRPLEIVENSLCPADVTCVWAGRLRLKVSIGGVPGEPVLELEQPFALPGGGAITLVAISPPNFHAPPPGLDLSRPPRFGFRSGRAQDGA